MAASNKALKQLARSLYTSHNMTMEEVGLYVDKQASQISRWKKADKNNGIDWDKERSVNSLTVDKLIINAYEEADAIHEEARSENRRLNSKEMDILVKLSAYIKNLQKELNVNVATLVFRGFNDHLIKSGKLETAKEIAPHEREFVLSLMPSE